ncbi:MAG: single-stranded DNA-binding protein [Bacteroidales bacterium]|jgi:single-strand DNA-binding protein|nr:single-stranded DNA-binding protein [Bacteroidales bacterium]
MAGINKVMLIGNAGSEPDIMMFNAHKRATFSLCTSLKTNNNTISNEERQWHHIVCWDKTADTAEQFVKKGSLLYVEGYLHYNKWTDKEGRARLEAEIVTENLQIIDSKQREKLLEPDIRSILSGNEDISSFDTLP